MNAAKLREATSTLGGKAYFALQGYPFTTFGRFRENGEPELPPLLPGGETPDIEALSWDLFWDVRVFGAAGDWHAWRDGGGQWRSRILLTDASFISRKYLLWGESDAKQINENWFRREEKRGACIWLPAEQAGATYLIARLKVGREKATGLAGIVDAALVGFE